MAFANSLRGVRRFSRSNELTAGRVINLGAERISANVPTNFSVRRRTKSTLTREQMDKYKATLITLPHLSPSMKDASIARWLVQEGEEVRENELLLEVQTDTLTEDEPKSRAIEVEAMDDGFLAKIFTPDGHKGVTPGSPIAIMCEDAKDVEHFQSVSKIAEELHEDPGNVFFWQAYLKPDKNSGEAEPLECSPASAIS